MKLNNKKIILLLSVLVICLLFYQKQKQNSIEQSVRPNQFEYNKARDLIFNNELRKLHGMAVLDSSEFSLFDFEPQKKRFRFEKANKSLNKVFKTELNSKDSLILDYYLIGKDSIFRVQNQIKNGKYNIMLTVGMLFTKNKVRPVIKLDEFLNFSKTKGLIKKGDTIFHGFNPTKFYGEAW